MSDPSQEDDARAQAKADVEMMKQTMRNAAEVFTQNARTIFGDAWPMNSVELGRMVFGTELEQWELTRLAERQLVASRMGANLPVGIVAAMKKAGDDELPEGDAK